MHIDLVGLTIACVLLGVLILAGGWDLYVLFSLDDVNLTVSHYLSTWARQFPVATLAVGVLLGHLVWGIARKD